MGTINKEQMLKLMTASYRSGGNDMIDSINDILRPTLDVDESIQELIDVFTGMKHEGDGMEEIDAVIKEITGE